MRKTQKKAKEILSADERKWTQIKVIKQHRHSGMLLAGEVVHGRTDNGPKDGVYVLRTNHQFIS